MLKRILGERRDFLGVIITPVCNKSALMTVSDMYRAGLLCACYGSTSTICGPDGPTYNTGVNALHL